MPGEQTASEDKRKPDATWWDNAPLTEIFYREQDKEELLSMLTAPKTTPRGETFPARFREIDLKENTEKMLELMDELSYEQGVPPGPYILQTKRAMLPKTFVQRLEQGFVVAYIQDWPYGSRRVSVSGLEKRIVRADNFPWLREYAQKQISFEAGEIARLSLPQGFLNRFREIQAELPSKAGILISELEGSMPEIEQTLECSAVDYLKSKVESLKDLDRMQSCDGIYFTMVHPTVIKRVRGTRHFDETTGGKYYRVQVEPGDLVLSVFKEYIAAAEKRPTFGRMSNRHLIIKYDVPWTYGGGVLLDGGGKPVMSEWDRKNR